MWAGHRTMMVFGSRLLTLSSNEPYFVLKVLALWLGNSTSAWETALTLKIGGSTEWSGSCWEETSAPGKAKWLPALPQLSWMWHLVSGLSPNSCLTIVHPEHQDPALQSMFCVLATPASPRRHYKCSVPGPARELWVRTYISARALGPHTEVTDDLSLLPPLSCKV